MNVRSLFSGIGGLDLGLHRAGHHHVFFCESDPYRRDVLRARWPGVPVHDDVRLVGRDARPPAQGTDGHTQDRDHGRSPVTPPGLLCGGFPCQDLSVAGRRAGLDGSRSGLFYEFARIADTLRPQWLLVENVPGLLSSNGGRDFGIVLGTLADIGYGVAWRILDSRFFGVPQRRRRVFIVGALADGDTRAAAGRAGQILAVGQSCGRHPKTRGGETEELAGTLGNGARGNGGGSRSTDLDGHGAYIADKPAYALNAKKGYHDGAADTNYAVMPVAPTLSGKNEVASSSTQRDKWMEQSAAMFGKVRRLTPRECERLQGLPDDWTQLGGTADARRYGAIGDAVTVNVAQWIGQRLRDAT